MDTRTIKPITPDEALANFSEVVIPDFVIQAVNELLGEKFSGSSSSVDILQKDIVQRIVDNGAIPAEETNTLFDKHYMDFENLYSQFGWEVSYDGPGYCEPYDAYYTFKKK